MRRLRPRIWVLAGALVGTCLGLHAGVAQAACTADPCAGGGSAVFDCDRDGYSDAEECSGLSAPAAAFAFPSCRTAPEPGCLDPTVPDVFVVFVKASGGSIYDQLGISNAQAFAAITGASGLPQRVHVLDPATPLLAAQNGLGVTSRQAAFRVAEFLTAPGACPVTSALGFTPGGGVAPSLNQGQEARVFTQRIVDHVGCVYLEAGEDPNGAAARQDKIEMIQHTTAHELTHNQRLAPEDVSRFGGHHYKTGSGCVMDQAVTYSTRRGVTFDTSLTYCGPSVAAAVEGATALGAMYCEDPDDVIDQDGFTGSCLDAAP